MPSCRHADAFSTFGLPPSAPILSPTVLVPLPLPGSLRTRFFRLCTRPTVSRRSWRAANSQPGKAVCPQLHRPRPAGVCLLWIGEGREHEGHAYTCFHLRSARCSTRTTCMHTCSRESTTPMRFRPFPARKDHTYIHITDNRHLCSRRRCRCIISLRLWFCSVGRIVCPVTSPSAGQREGNILESKFEDGESDHLGGDKVSELGKDVMV